MTDKKEPKKATAKATVMKKIVMDYPITDGISFVWGVQCTVEGEGEEACYVAKVDGDTAKSLIDAGRAKEAK